MSLASPVLTVKLAVQNPTRVTAGTFITYPQHMLQSEAVLEMEKAGIDVTKVRRATGPERDAIELGRKKVPFGVLRFEPHWVGGTALTERQYQLVLKLREHGLDPVPTGSYEQTRKNPFTGATKFVGRLESIVYDWIKKQAKVEQLWVDARELYAELWPENYYALLD